MLKLPSDAILKDDVSWVQMTVTRKASLFEEE